MSMILKNKKMTIVFGMMLLSIHATTVWAYELPLLEKRHAYATDLSIHNATFLRNGTKASVIGILKKQGNNYVLVDSDSKDTIDLPIDVDSSIKIKDELIDQKVRLTGKMTYQTMYFEGMSAKDGPAYSFKFELYSIELLKE